MTTTSPAKKSDFWWYIAAAVAIIIILTVTSYEIASPITPSPSPSPLPSTSPSQSTSPSILPSSSISPSPSGNATPITLYAGSVTSGSGTYGFGNSSTEITSPGPTLNFKDGTSYMVTVNNVANIPHSFEIVSTKAVSSSPLFGAGIGLTNYIPAEGSGSVTFTPDKTGNFYYVCTVPGHLELGMWGNVVVS